jgi:hypothetical protein
MVYRQSGSSLSFHGRIRTAADEMVGYQATFEALLPPYAQPYGVSHNEERSVAFTRQDEA